MPDRGERALANALEQADRSAPRPALRPVSLDGLQARARRHRLERLGAAATVVLLLGAVTALLLRGVTPPAAPAFAATHRQIARTQAELQRLLEQVAELQEAFAASQSVLDSAADRALRATERGGMAAFHYAERVLATDRDRGLRQLELLAATNPDSAGAHRARLLIARNQ